MNGRPAPHLKEREESKKLRMAELRKEILIGSKQADRGEFIDGPRAFAEARRRGRTRKPKVRTMARG